MSKRVIATALMAIGVVVGMTSAAAAAPQPAAEAAGEEVSTNAIWYIHSYHEASYTCTAEGQDLVRETTVQAYDCAPDSPYPQKPWTLRVLD